MRDLRGLPKAHLHVHLESAVRWSTVRELGGPDGSAVDGFDAFFGLRKAVVACLRRPEDFRRVAAEFCADEAAAGTRYAEVSFTAAAHGERLGDLDMPLVAVLEGLEQGRVEYGIECRVILDHSRRRPVDRAWRTLDLAKRYAADGVVAIGLAGPEEYPGQPFAQVFEAARRDGVHVVHHAGEACGPASIRQAVTGGQADRIGHGITVLDDVALVAELVRRRIALEVCPSSNVALGFVPSLAAHPLPALRDAGLLVTVSTDIPSVIGVSLAEEYGRLRDTFGFADTVLAELATNGVDASFAPESTKERLREEIRDWVS